MGRQAWEPLIENMWTIVDTQFPFLEATTKILMGEIWTRCQSVWERASGGAAAACGAAGHAIMIMPMYSGPNVC